MTLSDNGSSTIDSQSFWSDWGSDHQLVISLPRKGAGYVYVAWSADRSRPLYVGKAVTPSERITYHLRNAAWAAEAVEWEVHGFPTVSMAEVAEIEAIAELNPIHNVVRRMTQAQWDAHRRAVKDKEAAQQRLAADWQARRSERAKPPKPEPVYRPRPVRRTKWRDDVFTPEQLAIIARVQNRGRAA